MEVYKKIIIYFFLYVFCSFIITPAVIKVIEKNADVSCFYSLVEEEKKGSNTTELKEIKELPYPKEDLLYFSKLSEDKASFYYQMHHFYDQVIDVIIPPPEHIA